MPVNDTSGEAYRELKRAKATQVETLRKLLEENPGGISDRQIAERLGIPCALAAARRNDLRTKLDESPGVIRVAEIGKRRCKVTHKNVKIWGLVKLGTEAKQGTFF